MYIAWVGEIAESPSIFMINMRKVQFPSLVSPGNIWTSSSWVPMCVAHKPKERHAMVQRHQEIQRHKETQREKKICVLYYIT